MAPKKLVLIADPAVLKIPIIENGEPLVDLREQQIIAIGPSPEIENNTSYTKVRRSVFERLLLAQKALPPGVHLCLYEGLRTYALQQTLYNNRWKAIQSAHPYWNESEIYEEVIKIVSPLITLDGVENIPTHATGAAVDVYLVNSEKIPLEMGLLLEDWTSDPEGIFSFTKAQGISNEAKKNRRLLCRVMEEAGFVNYPTEYWHWSYGDRYWAFVCKKPFALFDKIK